MQFDTFTHWQMCSGIEMCVCDGSVFDFKIILRQNHRDSSENFSRYEKIFEITYLLERQNKVADM